METIKMRREIDVLKKRVKYLDDEIIKVLEDLYEIEEKLMDNQENQWMKIGQVQHVKYV